MRLLPYRVDAGARAYQERALGDEIDWVALAKVRCASSGSEIKRGG